MATIKPYRAGKGDWIGTNTRESGSSEESDYAVSGRSFSMKAHDIFKDSMKGFVPLYSTYKVISEGNGLAIRTVAWEAFLLAAYAGASGVGYGIYKGLEAIFS